MGVEEEAAAVAVPAAAVDPVPGTDKATGHVRHRALAAYDLGVDRNSVHT
jgi:hypothetical protein